MNKLRKCYRISRGKVVSSMQLPTKTGELQMTKQNQPTSGTAAKASQSGGSGSGSSSGQATFAAPPDKASQLKGIDWGNLTLKDLWLLFQTFVDLFRGKEITPQTFKATFPDCPDECCEHCCKAMEHALNAYMESYLCCQSMQDGGYAKSASSGGSSSSTP